MARAAKGHGEGWQGDEGGNGRVAELTETRQARGQEKEEDMAAEDDAVTGVLCFSTETGRRGRRRRGQGLQRDCKNTGNMLDMVG